MAEWSCSGLQSRGRRFDSDSRLQDLASGARQRRSRANAGVIEAKAMLQGARRAERDAKSEAGDVADVAHRRTTAALRRLPGSHIVQIDGADDALALVARGDAIRFGVEQRGNAEAAVSGMHDLPVDVAVARLELDPQPGNMRRCAGRDPFVADEPVAVVGADAYVAPIERRPHLRRAHVER